MNTALIGYTGFVGGNLDQQIDFSHKYNSKNIQEIKNKSFDTVYCAGIQAVVWWANQNPTEDWQQIEKLLRYLKTVKAKRFVLISTVDVYPMPTKVDEDFKLENVENVPYGKHRLAVENFVKERFPMHHIVRLPGLFGSGLKKNVIFDLLNENYLHALNDQCQFQYYDLKNLKKDIDIVIQNNIELQNFATEPIGTKEILKKFFPNLEYGSKPGGMKNYDFYTKNAQYWGKNGKYLYDKQEILDQLEGFINTYSRSPQ